MTITDGEYEVDEGPKRLDRALRDKHGVSWNVARRAIRSGKISVDDTVVREPGEMVKAGQRVLVQMNTARHGKKVTIGKDNIVFSDPHIVVVRKPPGIASVPDDERQHGTLVQLVAAQIRQRRGPLGTVQRLDVDTSGLLVFTRTPEAYEMLKGQFGRREVERSYLAIVAGVALNTSYNSRLVEHKSGRRGSTRHENHGKSAVTNVEVVEALKGATLVRCRLDTGRTHQIRIHLSEADHPLLGDPRYARRHVPTPDAPRLMLHADRLAFDHPVNEGRVTFDDALPPDMTRVLDALRL
jgi:23S rRNA pseudouridine1911/1915/1917 synthase